MEEMQVSCSGEQGFMNQEFELCIRCNKPTPYHPNTPITLRRYYVEGSGQLWFLLLPGALRGGSFFAECVRM